MCEAAKYSEAASNACRDGCAPGYYLTSICSPCNTGTFSGTPFATSASTCVPCQSGTFANTFASSVCTNCTGGTASMSIGASSPGSCAVCTAGKYANPGSSACLACEAGKRSSAAASTCTTCVAGTYSSELSEECSSCTPGKYSPGAGATSVSACLNCEAGKYSASTGMSACALCSAGTYLTSEGNDAVSDCVPCLSGTFSSAGSAACISSADTVRLAACSTGHAVSAGASSGCIDSGYGCSSSDAGETEFCQQWAPNSVCDATGSCVTPATCLGSSGGSTARCCRVEVLYDGVWGTVCDDSFGQSEAQVVCRAQGFPVEGASYVQSFGGGSGQIWMDDVECSGSESWLTECGNRGFGSHNCGHSEDVGVCCQCAPGSYGDIHQYMYRISFFLSLARSLARSLTLCSPCVSLSFSLSLSLPLCKMHACGSALETTVSVLKSANILQATTPLYASSVRRASTRASKVWRECRYTHTCIQYDE